MFYMLYMLYIPSFRSVFLGVFSPAPSLFSDIFHINPKHLFPGNACTALNCGMASVKNKEGKLPRLLGLSAATKKQQ